MGAIFNLQERMYAHREGRRRARKRGQRASPGIRSSPLSTVRCAGTLIPETSREEDIEGAIVRINGTGRYVTPGVSTFTDLAP